MTASSDNLLNKKASTDNPHIFWQVNNHFFTEKQLSEFPPLYFYVKSAHLDVIPGMREYVAEFTSPDTWGPGGYLEERGMIPMPDEERAKFKADAKNMTALAKR